MTRANLKVAVFDEHEIFRRGLKTCLQEEPGIEVIATEILSQVDKVDVVVVSVGLLPKMPQGVPLVICSDCLPTALGPCERQVAALLPRRTLRGEQLVVAVRAAAVGLRVEPHRDLRSELDDRSISVLRMLALGQGTREISRELHYSERTIKSVISGLEMAMGARTRAQCVAEAVRRVII